MTLITVVERLADNCLGLLTANAKTISPRNKQAITYNRLHVCTAVLQYLQGECQANEVHHHLLVSQLHAEKTQQSEEELVVLPTAALLLAAQVDVSVQLLAVLRGGRTRRNY